MQVSEIVSSVNTWIDVFLAVSAIVPVLIHAFRLDKTAAGQSILSILVDVVGALKAFRQPDAEPLPTAPTQRVTLTVVPPADPVAPPRSVAPLPPPPPDPSTGAA